MPRFVLLVALLLCGLAQAEPDTQRQQELRHLLVQDCGSCHGMTLKGGLGPSLRPEALRDTPDAILMAAVLEGRPGTPMPPWRGLLSEEDVRWLIALLRKGEAP